MATGKAINEYTAYSGSANDVNIIVQEKTQTDPNTFEHKKMDLGAVIDAKTGAMIRQTRDTTDTSHALSNAKVSTDLNAIDGDITSLKSRKANYDGYYYSMRVGSADNLAGEVEQNAYIGRRPTAYPDDVGNGSATIRRLKGVSAVKNQLVNYQSISTTTVSGVTLTNNNDGSFTLSGTSSANNYLNISQVTGVSANKKFLFIGCPVGGSNDTFYFGTYGVAVDTGSGAIYNHTYPYDFLNIRFDFKSGVTFNNLKFVPRLVDLTQMFGSGREPSTVDAFLSMYPAYRGYVPYSTGDLISLNSINLKTVGFNVLSLDTILGGSALKIADGQPFTHSSVASFSVTDYIKVIGGQNYYLSFPPRINSSGYGTCWYDASKTFISGFAHSGTTGVVGVRQAPANAVYMRTTIMTSDLPSANINLSFSGGRNGQYEPHWHSTHSIDLTTLKSTNSGTVTYPFSDGFKSAGSVFDEVGRDNDGKLRKAVKRIGKVDLGTLTPEYGSVEGGNQFVYTNLLPDNAGRNLLCAKYVNSPIQFWFNMTDKTISTHPTSFTTFRIRDDSYSDAQAFKTAMNGVYLFYELATPVEYTLDDEVPANYRIDDMGTEELVSESITPPMNADIQYPMNATDTLRNIPSKHGYTFLTQLCNAISQLTGGTLTPVWDSTTNSWKFNVNNVAQNSLNTEA